MTTKKYAYLLASIILFAIWCIDLLSFMTLELIYHYAKLMYLLIGPFIIIGCLIELSPDSKTKNTRKTCSICGEYITQDEDSIHYKPKNAEDDTEDYCEKCKHKVANK